MNDWEKPGVGEKLRMVKMFYILIMVVVTQVYTSVKDPFNSTIKMGALIYVNYISIMLIFKFPVINNSHPKKDKLMHLWKNKMLYKGRGRAFRKNKKLFKIKKSKWEKLSWWNLPENRARYNKIVNRR